MSEPPLQDRARDDFRLDADPRSELLSAGSSADGQPIPSSPGALRQRVAGFPVTRVTPDGVASLLETSRALIVLGYFKYEVFAVAALWSLMAVEAALRHHVPGFRSNFHRLIIRAGQLGILTDVQVEFLQTGRQLRNEFAHPTQQYVYTPVMALQVVETSHSLIAELFPDDPVQSTPTDRGAP